MRGAGTKGMREGGRSGGTERSWTGRELDGTDVWAQKTAGMRARRLILKKFRYLYKLAPVRYVG